MKQHTDSLKGQNQRQYPRIAVKPGYASVTLQHNDQSHEGHLYDVSMGGIRFELDEPVAAGEPVAVQLHLPGAACASIHARGVVVRRHDPDEVGPVRMGLSFTELATATDRRALKQFMTRAQPQTAVA